MHLEMFAVPLNRMVLPRVAAQARALAAAAPARLDASLLVKETKPASERGSLPDDLSKLQFGKKFTDHMLMAKWNVDSGWAAPEIRPYAPLTLDPCVWPCSGELCWLRGAIRRVKCRGCVAGRRGRGRVGRGAARWLTRRETGRCRPCTTGCSASRG